MADFIKYAEEMADRERDQTDLVRSALLKHATKRRSGLKLIKDVAQSTSTDVSTVQEEYWTLLHSGELRLAKGTSVELT